MKYFLLILASILSIKGYCQESKTLPISEDSLKSISKCYIVAGSGGGFTGQTVSFYFLYSGDIYRSNSMQSGLILVKKISRKEIKNIFKELKALRLEKQSFDHPGNMSYFLEQHKKGIVHSVTWGDPSHPAPPGAVEFYNRLKEKIR